jgi:hypothetical protein
MSSWINQLDAAKSVAEVVSIVRDYIATWTPSEIARLPVPCRPAKIRDDTDIASLHERLAVEYRMTRASGDALTSLQILTSFVVRASVRIAELGGNTSAPATTTSNPKRSGSSSGV